MGRIKAKPIISHDNIITESGKLIKVFWKDNTINQILKRVED